MLSSISSRWRCGTYIVCLYLRGLCRCCRWPGYCCWCYWDVRHFHHIPGPYPEVITRIPQAQSWGGIRRQVAGVPDAQLPWPKRFSGQEAGVLYKLPDQCCQAPGDAGWAPSQSRITGRWSRITFSVSGSAFSTCPTHPPSDAQIKELSRDLTCWAEASLLSYGYFTDYILKGKRQRSSHSTLMLDIVKMPFSHNNSW